MVVYDQSVWTKIDDFLTYVITNGLCTPTRAKEKSVAILQRLQSLDKGICTDRPSTHRSFGKREGYLYGFFKDKNSKAQWNYLYERFEDEGGNINVIVHDICCGGLKDFLQFISLRDMLAESCREEYLAELIADALR